MKHIGYSLFFLLSILLIQCQPNQMQYVDVPPNRGGYVPDAKTASRIAEAISVPIYGEGIYDQQPFQITLEADSIWHIKGTFNKSGFGGVVHVKIRKADAKVLYVMHGK
ncbi:hypothetical protein BKI52_40570 [marine bacterium AO1-C]|nr:hypothetical protein BKI52_40570 [marine bacterium AO1-C]